MEAATSVAEVLELAPSIGIPHQNLIVGDREGHIAWTIFGRIPLAAGPARLSGEGPWTSAREHPHLSDPPSGRLWTANARPIDDARFEALLGADEALLGAGYDLGARAHQIAADLAALQAPATPEDMLRKQAVGRDPFDLEAWYAENTLGSYLASGVEMAMWDIIGKAAGQPLYRLLGGAVRKKIELAACMGIRPYDEAKAIARQYVEMGFTTMKTKAGRRAEEDLEMVRGIRDGVGDKLRLRIDPNQGYAPEVAFPLAKDLEKYNLEYFEQPMPMAMIPMCSTLEYASSRLRLR